MIEVIMTLVIMAIVTIMATPSLIELTARQDLERSVAELKFKIELAQTTAAITGSAVQLRLNTTTQSTSYVSWNPKGSSRLVSSSANSYVNPQGYFQESASSQNFTGIKRFVICNGTTTTATSSRVIQVNRIGVVTDLGAIGGCSAT